MDINAQMRDFAQLFSHIIWITDPNGAVVFCNDYGLNYLGFNKEDLQKDKWPQTVHPSEKESITKVWIDAHQKKKPFQNIQRQRNKAGEYEWFKVNANPFFDENGEIINWLGISINIDKEINLSNELRNTNSRLDLSIKTTNSGIWDWDLKNNKIVYDDNWWKILGYSPDKVQTNTKSWERLLHPDEKSKVLEILAKHLNGETDFYESIYRLKTKKGNWKWIYDSGKVIERDVDETPLRFIGMQQDYTSRKHSENIIIESQEKMKLLADSAQKLLEIDTIEEIQKHIVEKFYEYLKYSALVVFTVFENDKWSIVQHKGVPSAIKKITSLVGKPIDKISGPLNKNTYSSLLAGKLIYLEPDLNYLLKDSMGDVIIKQLKSLLNLDRIRAIGIVKNNVAYGSISIIPKTDNITIDSDFLETLVYHTASALEKKQAEEKLINQNLLLSELNREFDLIIEGLSHDLRAPINTAQGILSIQNTEKPALSEKEFKSQIGKSINKLDIITNDLLGLVLNNRTHLDIQKINFEDFLKDCIEEQEDLSTYNEIEWKIKINQKFEFSSDHKRLKMIFRNILSNAIKYQKTKNSSKNIAINIVVQRNKAVIHFQDNGIGMQQKQLDKIFEMFYRANSEIKGIGLGLHIIKQTLEKIKGTIEVKSEYGKGTDFILTIPNLKQNS